MAAKPANRPPRRAVERHLLAKSAAGIAGGFGLAVAASTLLAQLSPGDPTTSGKFQAALWMVPPVWIAVAAAAPLFRSGLRATLALAAANLGAFALVVAFCRHPLA
ncbi:hypothetical protein CY652_08900 [Burkholderia sp. WAC0059]|uniref:hypothetical protein n=1 Tax=Burkholderia sp. WAC0059 TaxID=2066022 RepID=UPI000C7F48A2|nr:hypothetical protein [Burkholderia sp. WAC0059]PLZ02648.1 hypothetical protein CY652_08900 [Burkholderia sp. WAC0059]